MLFSDIYNSTHKDIFQIPFACWRLAGWIRTYENRKHPAGRQKGFMHIYCKEPDECIILVEWIILTTFLTFKNYVFRPMFKYVWETSAVDLCTRKGHTSYWMELPAKLHPIYSDAMLLISTSKLKHIRKSLATYLVPHIMLADVNWF